MGGNVAFDKWLNDDGSENFKCRAWVNFDGTGTVAIRGSGNVSSITDNGVGDYTVNFIEAMPDADYSMTGASDDVRENISVLTPLTSSIRITNGKIDYTSGGGVFIDCALACISIHR